MPLVIFQYDARPHDAHVGARVVGAADGERGTGVGDLVARVVVAHRHAAVGSSRCCRSSGDRAARPAAVAAHSGPTTRRWLAAVAEAATREERMAARHRVHEYRSAPVGLVPARPGDAGGIGGHRHGRHERGRRGPCGRQSYRRARQRREGFEISGVDTASPATRSAASWSWRVATGAASAVRRSVHLPRSSPVTDSEPSRGRTSRNASTSSPGEKLGWPPTTSAAWAMAPPRSFSSTIAGSLAKPHARVTASCTCV